jgi:hypothetical protein
MSGSASDRSSPEEEAWISGSSSPGSRRSGRSSGTRGTSISSSMAGADAGGTSGDTPTSATSTSRRSSRSTSSSAGSPASPSRSPDRAARSSTSDGSGRSTPEPFASYGPDGWSSRTSQGSLGLTEDSATSSVRWPRSGMTRNGRAFRRPALGPRITATASGSWHTPVSEAHSAPFPTPSSTSYGSSGNGSGNNVRSRGRPSLATMARKGLWPTPGANLGDRGPSRHPRPGHQDNLADNVARAASRPGGRGRERSQREMFPTPLVTDSDGGTRSSHGRPDGLQATVRKREMFLTPSGMGNDSHGSELRAQLAHGPTRRTPDGSPTLWPTPRASEWKGTGPIGSSSHQHRLSRSYLDATVQDREQTSGPLNPPWVEWLMGWPVGATDCGHSATESCPRSRR